MVHDVFVHGAPEAANSAGVGHFGGPVSLLHVVDEKVLLVERDLADPANILRPLLDVLTLDVSLEGVGVVELLVAVLALANVKSGH